MLLCNVSMSKHVCTAEHNAPSYLLKFVMRQGVCIIGLYKHYWVGGSHAIGKDFTKGFALMQTKTIGNL